MNTLVSKLESAEAALAREDAAGALADILEAWRLQHHSRIGVLAGRISALAGMGRPAIAGKTVKARLAAWLEVEKEHDLVDVERLLADPWPTQWRDGYDRFTRLKAWTPDPRLAALLTRAFEDPPYDSQASVSLRLSMLHHLIGLEDPRSRETVQANVEDLARSYDAARAMRRASPEFLAALDRHELLSPDVEARLAALEARFAGDVRSAMRTTKTQEEFLDAIYRDPSDTTAKTVFADWLTENGDPRGELIALQLAGRPGPRERALSEKISDDHTAFDWPVAQHFKRGSRRYEDGFFAGGRLERRNSPETEHPAWSHVRAIDLAHPEPGWGVDFGSLVELPQLRELTNIAVEQVPPLLEKGAFDQLEVLEIFDAARAGAPPIDSKHPLITTTKLPALKTLGIGFPWYGESNVRELSAWPILRRIERLMLRTTTRLDIGQLSLELARVAGPKSIEVRPEEIDRLDDADLIYCLERTETVGPFRRLSIRGAPDSVRRVLDSFPEGSFDFITLDLKRAKLRPTEQASLRSALDRFPNATVEPPFANSTSRPAPQKEPIVALLSLGMGNSKFERPEQIGGLMRHISKLGVAFDYYSVGYGNKPRPLKPDPIAKAEAMTKAGKPIKLIADGTQNSVFLTGGGGLLDALLELELGKTQVDGNLDWVVGLIEDRLETITDVFVEVRNTASNSRMRFTDEDRRTINPLGLWNNVFAYATLLDTAWTKRLELARWRKYLPAEPALAGIFFRDVGSHRRFVGLHAEPLAPTTLEEHRAFGRIVHRMVDDILEESHGYRWRELAAATLAPSLAALGLDEDTRSDTRSLEVEYGDSGFLRRLNLTLRDAFAPKPELVAQLQCASAEGDASHDLARGSVGTRVEALDLLERIAAQALADRQWFASVIRP